MGQQFASRRRCHIPSVTLASDLAASFVGCEPIRKSREAAMADPKTKFPEVQPGASLMLAWQVKGKRVLVVGGGEVSMHFVPFISIM